MVRAENLAQERPKGHARRVDPTVTPSSAFAAQSLADQAGIEEPGEESPWIVANRVEMAKGRGMVILEQRRPPPANLVSSTKPKLS